MLSRLRTELVREFVKDRPINPYGLFVQLLYVHLFGSIEFARELLVVGILFLLCLRENYFWWWGVLIAPHLGWLQPLNLLIGLSSCNERWKTLTFMYVSVDLLLLHLPSANLAFNLLALTGLLYENYHHMPFRNLHDNRLFFVGFSILWLMNFCKAIALLMKLDDTWAGCLFAVVLLGIVASFRAISAKLGRVMNGTLEELEHPWQVIHFIENAEQKMQNELEQKGIEKKHRQECTDAGCFCREPTTRNFQSVYTCFLYGKAFRKFEGTEYDDSLLEPYVMHLLRTGMFPKAVEIILNSKEKKVNFYKRINNRRVEFMLLDEMRRIEQNYEVRAQYENPFSYEKCCESLKRQLLDLIETKTEYWREVSRKTARVTVIRSLGRKYNSNFNAMHNYYTTEIKDLEKEIRIFSGSIIYNLFLLVATNYKELAESNIKALRKLNTVSNLPSEAARNYRYYTVKISLSKETLGRIENVNSSIWRLLDTTLTKEEICQKQVDEIIPQFYLAPHHRGIRELRSQRSSRNMGKNIGPFFVKTFAENIVPTTALFKYSSDVLNELSVIAIIKYIKSECDWVMLSGDAVFKYSSNGKEHKQLLETAEVKVLIDGFRANWEEVGEKNPRYFSPSPAKAQLRHDDNTYTVTIMSPLAQAFIWPEKPPLVLSFYNETATYFAEQNIVDDVDMGCVKKINVLLDQADTDSQASNVARQSEIIDIVKNFEKVSLTKVFRRLFLTVAFIFLVFAIALSLQNFTIDVTSTVHNGQLLSMLMITSDISLRTAQIANKGMAIYAIRQGFITEQTYGQIYGVSDYMAHNFNEIKGECYKLKKLISTDMVAANDQNNQVLSDALNMQLPLSTKLSNQTVEAQRLLHILVSDCFELATGNSFEELVSGQVFWSVFFPYYQSLISTVKVLCESALADQDRLNYILFALIIVVLGLSVVPIYLSSLRIEREEDYIYELMISIELDLIDKEQAELSELQSSLKVRSGNTMYFDEKESFNPGAFGVGEGSQTKSDNRLSQFRRKRNTELDMKGYKRSRWFFVVCLAIFVLFVCGLFGVKRLEVQTFLNNLMNYENELSWRNERLQLILNLKKKIIGYRPDEPIAGINLKDWLLQTIDKRKNNYLLVDSADPVPFQCESNNTICHGDSALSSELSINVFLQTLISENNDDLALDKIPYIELVAEASLAASDVVYPKVITSRKAALEVLDRVRTIVYFVGLVFLVVLIVAACVYLSNFKNEYIQSTRTITFLSEDMIKRNKRVQGFLQRLRKST